MGIILWVTKCNRRFQPLLVAPSLPTASIGLLHSSYTNIGDNNPTAALAPYASGGPDSLNKNKTTVYNAPRL